LLTVVAATLLATSLQNDASAGDPQNFFPSSNSFNTKYENPPAPAKKLPKQQASGYQNGVPTEKQDTKSRGPMYFDQSSQSYNVWHRPGEALWTARERCEPRKWCPRGLGDLGMKPRSGYRLDYHRFVLKKADTIHGPAFYKWSTEPRRCCEIEDGNGKCGCDSCKTKNLFKLKLFR
jgi:hypothetical protein